MEYRQLGRSGLRISTLTLGTMTFGGKGDFKDVGDTGVDDARRQIDMAIDAGVNLVDTADVYSDGESESIIGQAMKGRWDRTLLATKVRMRVGDGPNDAGLSASHIIDGCEASLRRLQTDHIDLYQVHEWDGQTPVEETLSALDRLVTSGKVRYVGCSNLSGWQMAKALGVAERTGLPRYVSTQIYDSLQERSAEYEVIPAAIDAGIGVLVWSPLAGGWLSGKYRRGEDAPGGSRHASAWSEPPVYDEDALYEVIDALVAVADGLGASPAQVALAWLLQRPGITSVVIGARTDEQLADNLGAASLTLPAEAVTRLEQVSRPRLIYPHWHQRNTASDRLSSADLSLLAPFLAENED